MSTSNVPLNPFKPGGGDLPPYLAGRESHLTQFATVLAKAIAEGRGQTAVMYGPRGVGKTVLLNSFAEQARERQAIVLRSTPAECGDSLPHLAENLWRLSVGRGLWGLITNWFNLPLPDLRPAKAPADGKQTQPTALLAKTLADACRLDGRARVLLLDEAHTIPPEVARLLLNVAQGTKGHDGAPFVLMLVGSPDLPGHLRSVGATFVERVRSVGVGLLEKADAMVAIRVPLEQSGMMIPDDLLVDVVEDAQCYPYFLQLWGEALWDYANAHAISQIDRTAVEQAAVVVDGTRMDFYDGCHQEMKKAGVTDAAVVAVAAAFGSDGAGMHLDQIHAVIGRHLVNKMVNKTVNQRAGTGMDTSQHEKKAIAMGEELVRAGFIWQPPDTNLFIPGIPGLMAYISEQVEIAARWSIAE